MNVSRQIGWSNESNLLYQILKQLNRLSSIMFGLKPKYKVYTALLTQSGVSDLQYIVFPSLLTIGVTYQLDTPGVNADFTNVGAPNNLGGTYFVATGTTPNNWDSTLLAYDTGAPVVTVLENTIGNVWFTYNNVGSYLVNSNNLFIEPKSMAIIGTPVETVSNNNFAGIVPTGPSVFVIDVVESGPINDLLYNTPIEIRVYN